MRTTISLLLVLLSFNLSFAKEKIKIHPIIHATFVIQYDSLTIVVDPASEYQTIKQFPTPDIVLITHTHGDHFNPEIMPKIVNSSTSVIGNKDAITQMGFGSYLLNGEKKTVKGIEIKAFPMYNTTTDRLNHHPKGNGNGYIFKLGDETIYISGDTEDTREMRSLKNIDHAFLCMNLPFTMTPTQAASAIAAFKPKKVYPYHYSQDDGYASVNYFKELVDKIEDCDTEVILLEWYPPIE